MGATWSVVELPNGSARLDVSGEVDLLAEAPLVEQVGALLSGGHDGPLLLDLAEVDFIDSSGVRALIQVHQTHGARVQLVAASPPVLRVLEIAGITGLLGLPPSLDGEPPPAS